MKPSQRRRHQLPAAAALPPAGLLSEGGRVISEGSGGETELAAMPPPAAPAKPLGACRVRNTHALAHTQRE